MRRFFRRLFRCAKDPRYGVWRPEPFRDFRHYRLALEAAYIAHELCENPCLPRNSKFFEQAHKYFHDHFDPRLEWPDFLAAALFFGTCVAIVQLAIRQTPWAGIASPVILGLISGRVVDEIRRARRWRADKHQYGRVLHFRRQRSLTWEYQ
jgi:hypothetical protein